MYYTMEIRCEKHEKNYKIPYIPEDYTYIGSINLPCGCKKTIEFHGKKERNWFLEINKIEDEEVENIGNMREEEERLRKLENFKDLHNFTHIQLEKKFDLIWEKLEKAEEDIQLLKHHY